MQVLERFQDGRLHLRLRGEVDHHSARTAMQEIEAAIQRRLPRDCVLDLGGVSFMDSSGIAVVLKTHRHMQEIGGRIAVIDVPPQPMKVLDASGIDRLVEILPREQEEYI